MDPRMDGTLNSSTGFQLENQSLDAFSNWELGNMPRSEITYPHEKLIDRHSFQAQSIGAAPSPNEAVNSNSFVEIEDDNHDNRDLSDAILRHIDQILMDEDMEDNTHHMLQDSSDFEAKERSFYEVLGQKYPPSPKQELVFNSTTSYSVSNSCISSSSSLNNVVDRFWDPPMMPLPTDGMYSESQVVWNSSGSEMLGTNGRYLVQNPKECENSVDNDEARIKSSHNEARGKKNQQTDENDTESNAPVEEFDDVWVYTLAGREKKLTAYIDDLQITGIGARGQCCKKQSRKIQVIDLTSLLLDCARCVGAGDYRAANELLKYIRQYSSPFGNGTQRLAHYFADALEARLAGTGSELYRALDKKTAAVDKLRAYCMVLVSSSLRKISNFALYKSIMVKSEKATKVHIIDFGISYGFQWPIFIHRVAEREGGPPKLRITGIDFPQPGPQPAEIIEDTGRRLAHYAKVFNVPFEYKAIAQNWETIKVEDLKIEKGEFVAVNCSSRAKNLAESSRTTVLDLIRKINPNIFIHGVVNGAYSGPFFCPRFREALNHYSTLFDMMDTIIPGDKPERMLIERSNFGREALNVVACENEERVERPETYRQWHMRQLDAGFTQVPFERKLMNTIMCKVRGSYDKNFVIDEDNQWLLMSWKGRVIYAISCWQPA